jgi:hypothetical protein
MSKERLYYAENASGRIYLSSPASDLQPGYILRSTTKTKDMDLIFNRLHEQEREHNQQVIDKLFIRGKENFDRMRSELRRKIGLHDTSNAEKNIIREALKRMDEKEAKLQQNTVYGVSAMQESPEPLPPSNKRIM